MTKREIVFMACRLMALYLFMSSFTALSNSLATFQYLASTGASITAGAGMNSLTVNINNRPATALEIILLVSFRLLPAVLHWVGTFGLWVFAREISIRMFESVDLEDDDAPPLTVGTEFRAIAFGCLGLFFLAQDIPNLCLWLINSLWGYVAWTSLNPLGYWYRPTWEWLIRIPLSLWFVFGLRGLAGLWRLAQEKGIAPVEKRSYSD